MHLLVTFDTYLLVFGGHGAWRSLVNIDLGYKIWWKIFIISIWKKRWMVCHWRWPWKENCCLFSSSLFWCYILKAFSYSSQESESFVIVGMFSPFSQFFYKLTSAFKSNAYTVCHFYKLTSAFKSVLWNKWTFFKFISGPQSSQINGLICGPKLFFFEFFLKNVKLEKFLFYFPEGFGGCGGSQGRWF